MNSLLSWIVEAHVLAGIMALAFMALTSTDVVDRLIPPKFLLWLGRTLLVAAVLAPGAARLLPRHAEFAAIEDVIAKRGAWFGQTPPTASVRATMLPSEGEPTPLTIPWSMLLLGLVGGAAVWRGAVLAQDLWRLRRIVRGALPLKRVGALDVRLSDAIVVPMSTRSPRRAYILMPAIMLADRRAWGIALRHEGQHHRHGDTAFAYVTELVRLLFAGNPLVGRWTARLTELQELACDAAVVGGWGNRNSLQNPPQAISPHAYGSCLLWVTEAAGLVRHAESALAGTASMTHGSSDPKVSTLFLERRIRMLSRYRSETRSAKRRGLVLAGMIGVLALGLTQAAAYAARGSKARDPISMVEAIKLAEAASSDDFAVVMNEDVLARLNLIVTDPGRAKFHRESLVRMAEFKEFISGEIERYKHPKQLLAVPLIESGYRNLPEKEHQLPRMTIQSAGLWQFIRQTARNYGLRVGGKVDDRQDVKLSTDAAMRYLARNHDEFKHWYLSLAAYNQGEGFVRNAIAKGGTRDAFKLIEQGHLGDYLVHLMAAAIVVAHPELVD